MGGPEQDGSPPRHPRDDRTRGLTDAARVAEGILERARDGFVIIDRNLHVLTVSEEYCRLTGYTREDLVGKVMSDFEASDCPPGQARFADAVRSGSGRLRTRHRCKDGSTVDLDVSLKPEGGGSDRFFVIFRDTSTRRQAAEQIVRQSALLVAINQVFREALTCDSEADVGRVCLRVAEELTGSAFGFIDEVGADGRANAIALSDPGWAACAMPMPDAVMNLRSVPIRSYWGRTVIRGETQVVNDPETDPDRRGVPEGHPQITSFLGVPLKRGDRTIGLIGLANKSHGYSVQDQEAVETLSGAFVEALDHKRAEVEVRRQRQRMDELIAELQRSNRDLEQFAGMIAHDLRHPLAQMMGYLHLLGRRMHDRCDGEVAELLKSATDGSGRMSALLDGLLRYACVGGKALLVEDVSLDEVVREVLDVLLPAIERNRAFVDVDPLPVVRADRQQILLVFQNLLDNALKYRGEAAPRIRVSAEPGSEVWTLSVQDNGPGIAPEDHGRAFTLFQRLDRDHCSPGTGLGLPICKRVVEAHGGRIWIESTPGTGATFRFTLPAGRAVAPVK